MSTMLGYSQGRAPPELSTSQCFLIHILLTHFQMHVLVSPCENICIVITRLCMSYFYCITLLQFMSVEEFRRYMLRDIQFHVTYLPLCNTCYVCHNAFKIHVCTTCWLTHLCQVHSLAASYNDIISMWLLKWLSRSASWTSTRWPYHCREIHTILALGKQLFFQYPMCVLWFHIIDKSCAQTC